VLITDYPLYPINAPQKTRISLQVNYPSETGSELPLLIRATLDLEADGIIAENTKILAKESSSGYIYNNSQKKIGEVYFGFTEALPHSLSTGKIIWSNLCSSKGCYLT
jgi:hypothetical protein